ncbi:GAF domain-containing protein [Acidovorax sp. HDW3]|uniref:HD domain-containing phosphohydrolase n=1 Tax=Acidovorax sp. HDW3 TaxID=2714923 RepID=UPI0014086E22|nr:HD domain-containing phosphohydrolase [Acidovorax sp. HDW3]QIL43916.1 GAF domain-containing protein [Acidovorax sp. HDW3]
MGQDSEHALLERLEQLNRIGAALSRERDTERLLASILDAAKELLGADGGTLYRVREDGQALRFAIVRTDSLGLRLGGPGEEAPQFPDLPLHQADGSPNDRLVAVHAAVHDRTVNIADAYCQKNFDFSGTRAFDARTGYRSQSFLTVPMKNHEHELIGVLQLINARACEGGAVRAFSAQDQHLAESLASQAAIALSNRQLIGQLEHLFESFVQLINLAIDEKSPYTGGHCQRVPALTMALAEAAHACTQGPLAEFAMTERDRYELKMAGLLHDCGKITTPVHVVDKATKLQTIFDRIDLIDTRFEVLKRDAQIDTLRHQLALRPVQDAVAEAQLQQQLQQHMRQLHTERDFLRSSNQGSEAMSEAAQQRVRDIAQAHQWRNPQGVRTAFLTAEEVDNLTIRAGTLTQAERDVINHHIVATIKMLESLPWPGHLKNVPEYAGGHHERMDGRGYPRGLTREQMSWQARMLGLADIFEALTAVDRPYKRGMKLSEALAIMQRMTDGGHIDPDLFAIFVRERVYLRYAQQFLDPAQVDID